MFIRVSQDPYLPQADAHHDHDNDGHIDDDHDIGIFDHDQHVGEYDEDDQDYDKVGQDDGKAHNDDMVEGEDGHHQLNAPHLGDSLPDVRVNHNFFQDLQAPCLTLSICAAYLFVFI